MKLTGAAPYRANRGGVIVQVWACILVCLLASAGCGTSSASRNSPKRAQATSSKRQVAPGTRQEGLASYYSNKLAGRRTASGATYRPEQLTAAHLTLPFGTRVRVTRLDGKGTHKNASVVVKITDRGPWGGKRIIDLSYAAAQALGMIRAGVVRVEILVLGAP